MSGFHLAQVNIARPLEPLDAPLLQASDPVGSGLGQRFTGFNGSLGGDGRFAADRFAYNLSLQGLRRSADVASLQMFRTVSMRKARPERRAASAWPTLTWIID